MSFNETADSLEIYALRSESRDNREEFFKAYGHSQLRGMMERQNGRGNRRTGIITDVEGSFWLEGQEEESRNLENTYRNYDIPVIAITGFSFQQVFELIDKGTLPRFPVLGTSTGAQIYVLQENGDYLPDLHYQKTVSEQVPWDRRDVLIRASDMYDTLSEIAPQYSLEWQNEAKEAAFLHRHSTDIDPDRICFYFYTESVEKRNQFERLAHYFFKPEWVIVTEERRYNEKMQPGDKRKRYCLDINKLSKLDAARYLVGLAQLEQGLVVGDGGNDIYMLRDVPNLMAVVTGTGRDELRYCLDHATVEGKGNWLRTIRSGNGATKLAYIEPDRVNRQAVRSVYRASQFLLRRYVQNGIRGKSPNDYQHQQYWHDLYRQVRRISH